MISLEIVDGGLSLQLDISKTQNAKIVWKVVRYFASN